MISVGYNPAPPGQYPLKRAIVDSDLDGITAGAIFKTVYPQIEIILGDPYNMTEGNFAHLIDKETATADLAYQPGTGLYFDHHTGNKPATDDFPGRWEDKNSAARVVYDYFKDVADLQKFAPMLEWVDKFDRGLVTKAEVESKNPVLEIGMAIQHSKDKEVKIELLNHFHTQQENGLLENTAIAAFLKEAEADLQRLTENLPQYTEAAGKIVFVDLREFAQDIKIHNYKYAALFPQAQVIVLFKKGLGEGEKATFYRNVFATITNKDVDLLSVARKINPEKSGGHKDACGATLPEDMSVEDAKKIILESKI